MNRPASSTTVISTKGQVILPKAIRDEKNWSAGARLVVEATPDGVLLRAEERPFPPTEFADVRGCLAGRGKSLSLEEIDAALSAAAKRRYARD
jgi:AbrB family looped-hinge helix DNA binding protein